MSFYSNINNATNTQSPKQQQKQGDAASDGVKYLLNKNEQDQQPKIKITSPPSGQKIKQSTATKFQFQVKNIDKVQVLADIPGGFGKVGAPIDVSQQTDFEITFNVPGKRKVKLEALSSDGKPLQQSNFFDVIDIEVLSVEQFNQEQVVVAEDAENKKKVQDLEFEKKNLQNQLSALQEKKDAVDSAQESLDSLLATIDSLPENSPLISFYKDNQVPVLEEKLKEAQDVFVAAGGQVLLQKYQSEIQLKNKQIQEILFPSGAEGAGIIGATESKLVKKATDPKEVGKKEDVQTTVVTESEETKQLLDAIKETESKEAITKSQFNVEKIKEELQEAIKGKEQSGKIVIEDVQNISTTRLRSIINLSKYLEDPIAFMGNYVWNYDILNPTRLVFRYAFPQNIIIQINKTTTKFVKETIDFLTNPENSQSIINEAIQSQSQTEQFVLRSVFDDRFVIEFSAKIRGYLEEQFPGKDFSFLEAKSATTKNIKFFWLWWNQVFYVNTPIFKQKFIFTIDENNVLPVNCALYFLEKAFSLVKGDNSIQTKVAEVQQGIESNVLIFKSDIFKLNYLDQLSNTNNYINKKNLPTVGVENITNVVSSPFFLLNYTSLSNKEKKAVDINTKTVKECKEVKDDKKITSLKLFYKEGNDNILDKKKPETGLGCSTTTSEWKQAEEIIFSAKSIDAKLGRVNYKIPYYNNLIIQAKNAIPAKLDVYQQGLLTSNASDLIAYNKSFEGLSSEIILNIIGKPQDDILIDNDLIESLNLKGTSALIDQYFSKYPNWGPQYIIDKIPFFNPQDTPFFKLVMLPYIGAFNAGYLIDKRPVNSQEVLQTYYINSNSTPELLNIYDSQVKYARTYNYDLRQIISFIDIRYRYSNPKLIVPTENQTEFVEETGTIEEFTGGLFSSTADTDPTALFGTGKISKTITFEFETKDIIYHNSVELIKTNNILSPISYVDLPPPAPFLRVYPQRAVNNKILLSFQKFSQSNKVVRRIVPKKYWTDGWEDARKFFVEVSENSPESFKNLAGDVTVTNVDDEMFFADQDVFLAKVYSSKGAKPTDILELEETKEINLFTDGFTTELDIEPNTKHYFAAKFVSFTGLQSYYSEVYEVELVDDGGTVFPVINVVELEEKVQRKTKIGFDKKFRVKPALLQQAPNLDKDDIGYLTPSVFTTPNDTKTRFKIRLTSKSTGRKVDFNIAYKKDFKKESKDAGSLNLNRILKDKILISYKSKSMEEKQAEENAAAKTKNTIESSKGAVVESSDDNICCKFINKKPLLPILNPEGFQWATVEPAPDRIEENPNEDEKKLNEKLLKIDRALNKINDDENTLFKVLDSMTEAEKCYLCQRIPDYAGPKSMLFVIYEKVSSFLSSEVLEVQIRVPCDKYGYSDPRGNVKGSQPIDPPIAKKCNFTVTKESTDLETDSDVEENSNEETSETITGGEVPQFLPTPTGESSSSNNGSTPTVNFGN